MASHFSAGRLPPGFLTQLGESAAALLALIFSLPERLFENDIARQLQAQRLTAG